MAGMEYHLYIVASRTPSFLGRIIRLATKFKHNHVSISLNDDLVPLYSFARYNHNAPFHGGFVEESWLRYLYMDDDISFSIYSISISKYQYQQVLDIMQDMKSNRYSYSLLSAVTRTHAGRKGYTCLTFVAKVLREIGVIEKNRAISSIQELEELLEEYYIEDRTILSKDKGLYIWGNDEYFMKRQ